MSIKPIEFQVMIPKTQELSQMKHNEQRASSLAQEQLAKQSNELASLQNQNVVETKKDHKAEGENDPRKEGKQKYKNNQDKKKSNTKLSQQAEEERNIGKGFDVSI